MYVYVRCAKEANWFGVVLFLTRGAGRNTLLLRDIATTAEPTIPIMLIIGVEAILRQVGWCPNLELVALEFCRGSLRLSVILSLCRNGLANRRNFMGDHWVSQFLLRDWEIPNIHNKGQIYVYKRKGNAPQAKAIKNIAQETNFNTAEIEAEFGKLESKVAPVILRLNRNGMNITAEEKEALCSYIGLLISNTPWSLERQRRMLYEHPEEVTDWIKNNNPQISNPDQIVNHIADHDEKAFKETNMIVAKDLASRLMDRSWKLAIAPAGQFFVISHNPISSTPLPETPYEWTDGFINYPIVLPISPQKCLYIIRDNRQDEICDLTPEKVLMINEYTCFFAQEKVFSHSISQGIQEMLDNTKGDSDDIIVDYRTGSSLDSE